MPLLISHKYCFIFNTLTGSDDVFFEKFVTWLVSIGQIIYYTFSLSFMQKTMPITMAAITSASTVTILPCTTANRMRAGHYHYCIIIEGDLELKGHLLSINCGF